MAKKVFAWSPVRKLMKDNGAEMVAREAVDALIDYLSIRNDSTRPKKEINCERHDFGNEVIIGFNFTVKKLFNFYIFFSIFIIIIL
jgi:hypothetical protein